MIDMSIHTQPWIKALGIQSSKVGSVFPIVVSILPHADLGPDHLVQMTIGKTHPTLLSVILDTVKVISYITYI